MAKNKTWVWAVLIVVALAVLFGWNAVPTYLKNKPVIAAWNDAGVNCLPGGHTALDASRGSHVHQQLLIKVDGASENLTGDMGIVPGCMAEVHVHSDTANKLHVETLTKDRKIMFGQFFAVYGKPMMRDGYNMMMKVNGVDYTGNPAELILEDKQEIELNYTKTAAE